MSSISCAVFTPRQPAVTGVALVSVSDGAVPGEHVGVGTAEGTGVELFARAVFLERRRHHEGPSFDRQNHREQALAQPPPDVGEIDHRGAAGQHDGVQLIGAHETAGPVDSGLALLDRDGRGLVLHRGERQDRRGQPLLLLRQLSVEIGRPAHGGGQGRGGSAEELAARDHVRGSRRGWRCTARHDTLAIAIPEGGAEAPVLVAAVAHRTDNSASTSAGRPSTGGAV
jgi:hypothetical protein